MKEETEAGFTTTVIQTAQLHGWKACHFRPAVNLRGKWMTAIQGDEGFPDVALCHRRTGRAIVAELKVGDNKPTSDQVDWLAAYDLGPVESYVWYPSDWPTILAILSGE